MARYMPIDLAVEAGEDIRSNGVERFTSDTLTGFR